MEPQINQEPKRNPFEGVFSSVSEWAEIFKSHTGFQTETSQLFESPQGNNVAMFNASDGKYYLLLRKDDSVIFIKSFVKWSDANREAKKIAEAK